MSVQVAEPAQESPWLDEVLASVDDGICVVGADRCIVAANPSFARHLRLPAPVCEAGCPFADLVRPLSDGGLVQTCHQRPEDAHPAAAAPADTTGMARAGPGLEGALEAIAEGLALFDADGALTFCNRRYRALHPEIADRLVPGVAFGEMICLAVESGQLSVDTCTRDELIRSHAGLEAGAEAHHEVRRADGRWLRISDRRASDGSVVSLRGDITEIKRLEATVAELSGELKRQRQLSARTERGEKALREYAARLERSNRELQGFASIASHDLQEPLRKIEAFGERLRVRCGDELGDTGTMYIDRMQNAAGRMRVLIDDLLTYSRVGTKANPFETVDLRTIVDEVLSDLQVTLEQAEGCVAVGSLPTIDADPIQLRQLIQNLLSNALKFRRQGVAPVVRLDGRLLPAARPGAPERCEVQVADNGIGFEPDHADRIFGIFQRLHGRSDYEGTGIGLATCRRIVERHGGTIVAAGTPGEGATFTFTLPARQPAGDPEP